MTFPNVGLCGKLRSGKDSVAAHLVERHGYSRYAFGDELKRYAHELFDVPADAKPRELYQWFGQTMRQRDPDVWVRKCFDTIDEDFYTIGSNFNAVITDVRQPNEYIALKAQGYVLIRVDCPENLRIERAKAAGDTFTDEDLRHETEQHVDSFEVDYVIDNSGTLAELHSKVDELMAEIKERTVKA